MKKLMCVLLACLLALPLAGCGGAKPQENDFYTLKRVKGDGSELIRLNITQDECLKACPINWPNESLWIHFDKNLVSTSMTTVGGFWVTLIGGLKPVESKMADVLPAYAAIPNVTVVENTPDKIVLEKSVDGTRYSVTFEPYSDGSIKKITLTNEDTYTK